MSVLSKRVSRLEGKPEKHFGPIAVVSEPLPEIVTKEWGSALLEKYGWSGQRPAVTVCDGPARLILDMMPLPPEGSDAEKIWLDANRTYPQGMILGSLVRDTIAQLIEKSGGKFGRKSKRHDSATE